MPVCPGAYGTEGVGKNTGVSVSGKYSTNGNITGVMDWGRTKTYTAGIIESYASKTLTDKGNTIENTPQNVNVIRNNSGTNSVDKFNGATRIDMAGTNWYNTAAFIGSSGDYPYSQRIGLFRLFCWCYF